MNPLSAPLGGTSLNKEDLSAQFMEKAVVNDTATLLYAHLLASHVAGEGVMPSWLGLGRVHFEKLLQHYFHDVELDDFVFDPASLIAAERFDETEDLEKLFLEHRCCTEAPADWASQVLVAGCMGGDHLWQDMGFWSRQDLSDFISAFFPTLAEKNIHDMKWKRFFYKQLCEQEGIHACRAPSCQVCADYNYCFGPE